MHYRNEEPWKGYYTEEEKRSYNLATTNFYLNLKHQLESDIKEATKKIQELEDDMMRFTLEPSGGKQLKAIRFQVGRIDQARDTMADLDMVYQASLQELTSN